MSLQMQYLREKIETARTLLGVVETMRGLAAVNIRRAEAAAEQSAHYSRTVHLALHAALTQIDTFTAPGAGCGSASADAAPVSERFSAGSVPASGDAPPGPAPASAGAAAPSPSALASAPASGSAPGPPSVSLSASSADSGRARATWLLITTDMGLCGQFNERIVAHAIEQARRHGGVAEDGGSVPGRWLVVGLRGLERLEDAGAHVIGRLDAPGSVEAIPGAVAEAVAALQSALAPASSGSGPIFIVHNRPDSGSTFHSRQLRLFPLEAARFRKVPEGEPPWRAVPMTAPSPEEMLPRLAQEQMYIDLFQAFVESFVAENAARLASMKNAADNIEELLEDLEGRYRQERQDAITTELMELLSGVEAVRGADEY